MANTYEYIGSRTAVASTSKPVFVRIDGSTSEGDYLAILNSSGQFLTVSGFIAGAIEEISGTWTSYRTQLASIATPDPTNTKYYQAGSLNATSLAAGHYTLLILAGAGYTAAVESRHEAYWSGSKWYTIEQWDTIQQAAILTDTGTTLPALIASMAASGPPALEPVPTSRTAYMTQTVGSSLINAGDPLEITDGNPALLYAAEFSRDLADGQQLASIVSIEIETGEPGGITFNASTGVGTTKTQAKWKMTAVTPGDYVLKLVVLYSGIAGSRTCRINATVVE